MYCLSKRYCPRMIACFYCVAVWGLLCSPPAWAQKKPTETERESLKLPRELRGESWRLPPVGGPMGKLPGITQDGVQLAASFYPGNVDKETVPVVLMHGAGGNRDDFKPLITSLSSRGTAVFAVDFRGHGQSNRQYRYDEQALRQLQGGSGAGMPRQNPRGRPKGPTPVPPQVSPTPKLEELAFEDLQPRDYAAMVNDLTLVKKYLDVQNDRGFLNLNRLVLLGVDTGASLAGYWAMQDWEKGASRQTKMLILVSPNTLSVDHDMGKYFEKAGKAFKENVHVLIIVPTLDSTAGMNATKIKSALMSEKELANDPPGFASRVPIVRIDTDKSGAELLSTAELGVCKTIEDFIADRFEQYKPSDYQWTRGK